MKERHRARDVSLFVFEVKNTAPSARTTATLAFPRAHYASQNVRRGTALAVDEVLPKNSIEHLSAFKPPPLTVILERTDGNIGSDRISSQKITNFLL